MNRRRTVEIAVDVHGMFASVDDAMAHCAGLEDLPILCIEDPFQSLSARDVRKFVRCSPSPVASGEDVVGLSGLQQLLEDGVS